jgi:HlyD family secretion protein/adhesin transport system membrane fusion protein
MPSQSLSSVTADALSRRRRDIANASFLKETGVPGLIRASVYIAVVAVTTFVVWAYFASIQEIVLTVGHVAPRNEVRTIQHLEGGIISKILVQTGQRVDAGDPIVRLDASNAEAELGQYNARLASLKLEEERNRAFAENRTPAFDRVVDGYDDLKKDQTRILASEEAARLSQAGVLQKQVQERRAARQTLINERANLVEQLKILDEEFSIQENLFKKGLRPRLDFLSAKQNLSAARGALQKIKDEIATMTQAVGQLEESLRDLDNRLRQDALRTLGTIIASRAEVEKVILSLQDRVDRLIVKSPVSGIVQSLPLQANAGVLPPGGIIAEIVPLDGGLIVESRIMTRDIGFLEIGQPVTIKVDSFDYARYGSIQGHLFELSPTTFLDEGSHPYYRAKIALDKIHVGDESAENSVLPGMTVQADIVTGERTFLQYLLKPLYTVVNEAFWER